jgi:hypothetical protein
MSVRLGDTALDFSAESSEGQINFHQPYLRLTPQPK